MMQLRQRQPRETDAKFLAFIRTLPCCACGIRYEVQAAHIRMGSVKHGKRQTGMGERPDDKWTLPICAHDHLNGPQSIHRAGEEKFWQRIGIDPFALAIRLYADFKGERL